MDIKIVITIAKLVLQNVSKSLREGFVQFIKNMEVKAKETKNPFDDVAIMIVKTICKIK